MDVAAEKNTDSGAVVQTQPSSSAQLKPRKAKARSRVSNGIDILPGIKDARVALARRYRDLVSQIVIDVGGVGKVSEAKLQLIRRFAAAACMAEALEARLVNGERIDILELNFGPLGVANWDQSNPQRPYDAQ